MSEWRWRCVAMGLAMALAGGCAPGGRGARDGWAEAPPPVKLATDVDPAMARADYWYDQPATQVVESEDFDRLWATAERVAKAYLFRIDRRDYRGGMMTTEPMTSKQFFEFWRRDTQTLGDLAHSSLTTVRRTVRFEFQRREDGTFTVSPKVLVEQLATAGQRVTAVQQYRHMFQPGQQRGSIEEDQGVVLPASYWYAVGRDEALEAALERAVQRELGR